MSSFEGIVHGWEKRRVDHCKPLSYTKCSQVRSPANGTDRVVAEVPHCNAGEAEHENWELLIEQERM